MSKRKLLDFNLVSMLVFSRLVAFKSCAKKKMKTGINKLYPLHEKHEPLTKCTLIFSQHKIFITFFLQLTNLSTNLSRADNMNLSTFETKKSARTFFLRQAKLHEYKGSLRWSSIIFGSVRKLPKDLRKTFGNVRNPFVALRKPFCVVGCRCCNLYDVWHFSVPAF